MDHFFSYSSLIVQLIVQKLSESELDYKLVNLGKISIEWNHILLASLSIRFSRLSDALN